MSALPQPVLKLDRYGRNPESPSERLRRRKGFVPLPYSFLADVARLSSGSSCMALVYAVHAHACWDMKMDWSVPLPLEDWAQLSCCDVRTVQRDRDYLKGRGMADVQVDTKRRYSFKLRYQSWQALEDYATWKAKQKPVESEDEPEPEDDPSRFDFKVNAGTVRLLKAPAVVKGGKTSRAWPVNCGVKSVQVSNPNSLDLRYDAVVQAGRLLITPQVIERRSKGESVEKAKSVANKDTSLNRGRHGCRPDAFSSPPTCGDGPVGRTKGEHPRAAELSSLFDPLLLRSCHRTLSDDTVALECACNAVGDVDHDFLVKWVIERAERPIRSPKHCGTMLKECRKNWEKVKNLPAAQRIPPQSVKRKGFVENVYGEIEERIRRSGRV